jgi:hypothetical protein
MQVLVVWLSINPGGQVRIHVNVLDNKYDVSSHFVQLFAGLQTSQLGTRHLSHLAPASK